MSERGYRNSQQFFARLAGIALLAIIAFGLASIAVESLGGSGSTVAKIAASETRYRLGLTCEFFMLNCDVLLAVALYGLLEIVNRPLALLGTAWRCANAIVLGVGVAAALTALQIIKTPAAVTFLDLHDALSPLGLLFWSLGAGVHSRLLWVSNYIPRVLSGSYLAITIVIFFGGVAIIVSPRIDAMIDPWFVLPDLPIELAVGLWLAMKGANIPSFAVRTSDVPATVVSQARV